MSTEHDAPFIVESFDGGDPLAMAGVLFAEDFEIAPTRPVAAAATAVPVPEPEPITEADVQRAQAQAFAEGLAAGRAELQSRLLLAEEAACTALSRSLVEQAGACTRASDAAADGLARIVLQVFADLLPELTAHHGPAEVQLLARTVLPMLALEPVIAIRANPHTVSALQRVTSKLGAADGRITLIGTDALDEADVTIEWKHGAVRRQTGPVLDQLRIALAELGVALPSSARATASAPPQPADRHIEELADA